VLIKCCLFCLESKTCSCAVFICSFNTFHYYNVVSGVYNTSYRQNYVAVSSDRNDLGADGEYRYIYKFP
jgi:hypothetical protein